MTDDLIRRIDGLLPQTQCTRCGFDGCRPYAPAIAEARADIDQCPPGGDAGVARLAALLGRAVKPLNPEFGEHTPPRVLPLLGLARNGVFLAAVLVHCARRLLPPY